MPVPCQARDKLQWASIVEQKRNIWILAESSLRPAFAGMTNLASTYYFHLLLFAFCRAKLIRNTINFFRTLL